MTTATQIMQAGRNSTDAMTLGRFCAFDVTQDWEHEATLYVFEDDSVLVVSGPQFTAYADVPSANAALNAA